MKNTITIFIMVLVLCVLYGLNMHFKLIEIKDLAIGVAGAAGPFQYLRNLISQKREEAQLDYRRLENKKIKFSALINKEKIKSHHASITSSLKNKIIKKNKKRSIFSNAVG